MQADTRDLLLLTLIWLAYFGLHSLLASLRVKEWVARKLPEIMPAYRLLSATILLAPPLWLTFRFEGPPVFVWPDPLRWLSLLMTVTALAAFFWSLRYYDTREFLGLRQWYARENRVEDQERFRISPMHRFVRHPWYSLALVLVWCRDMNAAMLVSSIAISAYFVVGSHLEERKLIQYHGEVYRKYRNLVPGLIPLPWRYLDRAATAALQRESRQADSCS